MGCQLMPKKKCVCVCVEHTKNINSDAILVYTLLVGAFVNTSNIREGGRVAREACAGTEKKSKEMRGSLWPAFHRKFYSINLFE